MKKQHFPNIAGFIALALLVAPLMTWATGCQQANRLYNDSLRASSAQQSDLLNQAIRLCPDHVQALNNRANLKENMGNLHGAQWDYRRIITADPNFALAYAGLGDVLMKKQDYQGAAVAFQNFLDVLDNPGNQKFKRHAERYKALLKQAQNHILVSSANKDKIFKGLTATPPRGFGPPKVDVQINFKTGSAKIGKNAWQQCREMATAIHEVFKTPGFQYSRIRVEGHTDNVGDNEPNQKLSQRRAKNVKTVLVKHFKVPADRLTVLGWGEERPITKNKTEHERFLNRRVTLIRLDK